MPVYQYLPPQSQTFGLICCRVDIWRDQCDRRSCKILASRVNLSENNAKCTAILSFWTNFTEPYWGLRTEEWGQPQTYWEHPGWPLGPQKFWRSSQAACQPATVCASLHSISKWVSCTSKSSVTGQWWKDKLPGVLPGDLSWNGKTPFFLLQTLSFLVECMCHLKH